MHKCELLDFENCVCGDRHAIIPEYIEAVNKTVGQANEYVDGLVAGIQQERDRIEKLLLDEADIQLNNWQNNEAYKAIHASIALLKAE